MAQPKMERFTLYLPAQMREKIEGDAKKSGVPEAEIVRRIFDAHYERKDRAANATAPAKEA